MPRGNGKQAKSAAQSNSKLSAYVKPKAAEEFVKAGEYVDWGEIDPRLVSGAVWAAAKLGGAIMFGSNREKTCYSVRIYDGADGTSYYFPCNPGGVENAEEFLQGLIAVADSET